MNWRYDASVQEHLLAFKNSTLARIMSTPMKHGGFKVTTLVSAIYFGSKSQKRAERLGHEWVACRRKFKSKESAEIYISCKKQSVVSFMTAREKESR